MNLLLILILISEKAKCLGKIFREIKMEIYERILKSIFLQLLLRKIKDSLEKVLNQEIKKS